MRIGKPGITFVGAGSLARTLAHALLATDYHLEEIISRELPDSRRRARTFARLVGARAVTFASASYASDLFWIGVSDSAIGECARHMASRAGSWKGKVVLHSSGALTSDELSVLRQAGAKVASLHPMMTFVPRSLPSLYGVEFAFEGDSSAIPLARHLVRDLGGRMFIVRKPVKTLYHAWGAFGSPLLVMELALAERIASAVGLSPVEARKIITPLIRRTLENYFDHGAAAAFSGPFVRGDAGTVKRHLQELAKVPGAREVYVALARTALTNLPVAHQDEIKHLLDDTDQPAVRRRKQSAAKSQNGSL